LARYGWKTLFCHISYKDFQNLGSQEGIMMFSRSNILWRWAGHRQQNTESVCIRFFAAESLFIYVTRFQSECGKAIEIVFDVSDHDDDVVTHRFIIDLDPAKVRSDCVRFTIGRILI
jgi:hypothetical protein